GGKGGNFSNSFIQLKTMIEKLKYIRRVVSEFIYCEMKLVKESMDIKTLPRIKFAEIQADDQNINKKLILGLVDRGLISVEAVLDVYGQDYMVELERIKRE